MSEAIEVRLDHERHNLRGILRFDGAVVEIFGFNDVHSVRMHIHHIESAEASFKSGMLASPMVQFKGRGGALGYTQAIEPQPEQQPEIESFCAAVTAAAQKSA
jgi:hypothetical protein